VPKQNGELDSEPSLRAKYCVSFCVFSEPSYQHTLRLINFMQTHLTGAELNILFKLHHFNELAKKDIESIRTIFNSWKLSSASLKIVNLSALMDETFPNAANANSIPPNYFKSTLCKPLAVLFSKCDEEVVMDFDILPFSHPFALLNSREYKRTGLVSFSAAFDLKYCPIW
jgi:hypothetical protein